MMENIYLFFPMFANGMVALALLFKLYKRSISAFIFFLSIAVTSDLIISGYIEVALILLIIAMITVMARAMTKYDQDRFFRQREQNRRSTDKQNISSRSTL